ncbi:MAG: low molecular weight phosphotyrosine protein phosphatase [Rikenellaceae bacterium]|nr:low molecular weight phosphotyrosine protein phosphatase [Rikenellaceae bacterium]
MNKRFLFVCLGNICRSPAAHGIMDKMVAEKGLDADVVIDSAGTYGGHAGELPDPRMRAAASKRRYDLRHRSRQFRAPDFDDFDLIVVMDDSNYDRVCRLAPDRESLDRVVRMTDYCTRFTVDHVPDPYYDGERGFEHVLDILEDAVANLIDKEVER